MVNATFNNISVISWQSVLLVEETRVPEENHRPATSHSQIEIVIYKLEALSAQLGLHLSK